MTPTQTMLAPLVTLSIAHLFLSGVVSTTLSITNQCTYTVWPALASSTGSRGVTLPTTGFSLQEGETKNITAPASWVGRVWGRTKCSQNSTGNFSCVTGDCGSGKVECSGYGADPVTLAEFGLSQSNGLDFFDVSVVNGYNLPVLVTPQGGSGAGCISSGCVIDLNDSCPSELSVLDSAGDTVACEGPCGAFRDARFCCTARTGGNITECRPTLYSEAFKKACPRAYSYPQDDANSTFTCGSSPDYQITFCGLVKTTPNSNSTTRSTNNTDPSPTNSTTTLDNAGGRIGPAPDKKKLIKILVSSVLAAGMLLLVLASLLYFWRRKLRKNGEMKDDIELPLFDLDTVASATSNFCVSHKLGQGGYGPVYKGKLKDGQEIAVKTLSKNSRQGQDEFMNEVMHIVKLQHRNLVKLLGCCIQGDEKMLIYEFMPNKSLDFFIFDPARSEELDWPKRYHIINGIARGLLYLHQDSRLRIIHRDLKASNILLDEELNPKISDFGLARSTGGNETEINTLKVAGTYGYIAPEYAVDGLYSVKSDVFSFGVMVLEIVSGNRNRGYRHPNHNLNLIGHAWRLFQEGKSLELITASWLESSKLSEVVRTIHVGLLCVQCLPKDRPTMSSVVSMLTSESELPLPKQPGFFTERAPEEADRNSSSHNKPCSANELTITLPEAR